MSDDLSVFILRPERLRLVSFAFRMLTYTQRLPISSDMTMRPTRAHKAFSSIQRPFHRAADHNIELRTLFRQTETLNTAHDAMGQREDLHAIL